MGRTGLWRERNHQHRYWTFDISLKSVSIIYSMLYRNIVHPTLRIRRHHVCHLRLYDQALFAFGRSPLDTSPSDNQLGPLWIPKTLNELVYF